MQSTQTTNEYAHLSLVELRNLNIQVYTYIKKSKKKRKITHLKRVYFQTKMEIKNRSMFGSNYKDKLSFLNDKEIKVTKPPTPSLDFLCDKQINNNKEESSISLSMKFLISGDQLENERNYILFQALLQLNQSLTRITEILM